MNNDDESGNQLAVHVELNRTSCTGGKKSKISARVRIKPATDRADALSDTETLYPILHPVILCCIESEKKPLDGV